MSEAAPWLDAEACELTIRGTPLRATTGSSQASAPRFSSLGQAVELAGLVCPQGCGPAQPAASPAGGPVASAEAGDTTSWEDHEFRNPASRPGSQRKQQRALAFQLRHGLRKIGSPRCAACGYRRIAREVEVVRRTAKRDGGGTYQHAYYKGLLRCGSVWECPCCSLQIRAERANDLKRAVEAHGAWNILMLSATVRHGIDHDLATTRRGVSKSFSAVINGKPYKGFARRFGIEHQVRALEVTHGPHGWHPHIHVLFFLEVPLSADELEAAKAWLQARWAKYVRKFLGSEFVPSEEHGVDLRSIKRADYLAKLGLELANPGTKRGRRRNRSPLQIAISAASGKSDADERLWVNYCKGMRGAKMLTWSRGARAALGLDDELADKEVVDAEAEQEAETVAVFDSRTWDSVRGRGNVPCEVLEAAELASSLTEAFEAIQGVIRARRGPDTARSRPP